MKKGKVKIYAVTYHKIYDAYNFERQLLYLKEKFNIIGYKEIIGYFQGDQLPENPVILTFDDGDISNYQIAFPLLKKYNMPAIFFVITNLINTDKPFWWDEIKYYLGKSRGSIKVRETKKMTNQNRRSYLHKLRKDSEKPLLKYPQLTTLQLKEMQEEGILIANHSHTHPMFDKCTPEEIKEELFNSCGELKNWGFNSKVFAYPNGNFSGVSEEILKEHGIKLSFLFDHKINKGISNPLRISRLIVDDTTPLWKFKFILSGWHSRILPITKFLGKLK